MKSLLLVFFVFFMTYVYCINPFEISFALKKEITKEDYYEVQSQLSEIDIDQILKPYFEKDQQEILAEYDFYRRRVGRGLNQIMIATEEGMEPMSKLYKINQGSDSCIVTCAPISLYHELSPHLRYEFSVTIRDALEATGFNGYFLLRAGGYPNPTGEEIRYSGVPYAFKIFMMQEAKNLGFNKVIWIDSACLPLIDPKPLFDVVEQTGAVFLSFKPDIPLTSPYIFPTTRQLIRKITGVDCLHCNYVCSIVLGLNMGSSLVQQFVKEYYEMVRLGTPFISCFPEEFVFSALLGHRKYRQLHHTPYWDRLFSRAEHGEEDTQTLMDKIKSEGYYFFQRQHQ